MLYLNFSCTQRLMTTVSPDIKNSLEDRVCAVFSSVFLLVDASFHLFATTYKSFGWAASQISRKNPPDYYKETYSHLIKALRYISMVPFGSLVGFIRPNVFQSKKLQEYFGWKTSLTNNSKIIENKELKEKLQLKDKEMEQLKLQVDSLNRIILLNNSQPLEINFASDKTVKSIPSYEDTISISSEDEFIDAEEELNNIIQTLEKKLQLKDKEMEQLKLQRDLLNKILSPIATLCKHNQILVIQKTLSKSIIDAPTIYGYLSDSVKQAITTAFQRKLNKDFLQFCIQKNPDINSTSDIFADLLRKYPLSWSLTDNSISTVIGYV